MLPHATVKPEDPACHKGDPTTAKEINNYFLKHFTSVKIKSKLIVLNGFENQLAKEADCHMCLYPMDAINRKDWKGRQLRNCFSTIRGMGNCREKEMCSFL